MQKIITLLLITVVFLSSCASSDSAVPSSGDARKRASSLSMQDQKAAGYWIMHSADNAMIIIGVSSPQSKRDMEIENAKYDAAQKAAMYHGIQGSVETLHNVGAASLDYTSQSAINLEFDTDYEKYKDRLTFDPVHDVLTSEGAVYVRFKYSGAAPAQVDYHSVKSADGKPGWISQPPQIAGYMTAIGFARNQRWLKDTIAKSLEAAAGSLISELSAHITAGESAMSGAGASSAIRQRSEGKLKGFEVLEIWIEPGNQSVWTLVIAKEDT